MSAMSQPHDPRSVEAIDQEIKMLRAHHCVNDAQRAYVRDRLQWLEIERHATEARARNRWH